MCLRQMKLKGSPSVYRKHQVMVILSEICQGKKCKQVCLVLLPLTDFAAVSHSGDT